MHSDTVIDGGLGGREGGAGRIDHRTYAIHAYACMIEFMRGGVEAEAFSRERCKTLISSDGGGWTLMIGSQKQTKPGYFSTPPAP